MIPSTLKAGDSWLWTDEAPTLRDGTKATPPDYTQSYSAQGPGLIAIASTALPDGTGFLNYVAAATTKNYPDGIYVFDRYVKKGVDRYTISSQRVELTKNLETVQGGFDSRSWAQKSLDLIEQTILSNLGKPMLTQQSAATMIGYRDWSDMMSTRSKLILEVRSELASNDPTRSPTVLRYRRGTLSV